MPLSQAARVKFDETPTKIDENATNINENSMQDRSWEVLGARSRFGDAPGRARDMFGTLKKGPRIDLAAFGAGQERVGTGQKPSWAGPGTLLDDFGAVPKRAWCTERWRTGSRNCFTLFLSRRAKARSLKFVRPRNVS